MRTATEMATRGGVFLLLHPQTPRQQLPSKCCRFAATPFFSLSLPSSSYTCRPHPHVHVSLNPVRAAAAASSSSGSGLEASISDRNDSAASDISLKNAKVVMESQQGNNIQVRVDLNGNDTSRVFDKILTDFARSAPPIPGFRREKGGKTTKVPRDFLLQILGEDRVTNFVIQEIVSLTVADYVKKENLKVKDNKIETIQKAEELKKLFTPGDNFGFNAKLELEDPETGTETKSETEDETSGEKSN